MLIRCATSILSRSLLIELPNGEPEPTKYFLSTLPADIGRKQLVHAVKSRWRIERDYQELKQEFGLDNFEGRSWRGFHHHAAAPRWPMRACQESHPARAASASHRQDSWPVGQPRRDAALSHLSHSQAYCLPGVMGLLVVP